MLHFFLDVQPFGWINRINHITLYWDIYITLYWEIIVPFNQATSVHSNNVSLCWRQNKQKKGKRPFVPLLAFHLFLISLLSVFKPAVFHLALWKVLLSDWNSILARYFLFQTKCCVQRVLCVLCISPVATTLNGKTSTTDSEKSVFLAIQLDSC